MGSVLISISLVVVGIGAGVGSVFAISAIRKTNINKKIDDLLEKARKDSEKIKRDYLVFSVADIFNKYMKVVPTRKEDNFLMSWRNYYELKLNEITETEDVESSEIDLNEFRSNYDF
jgi:biotin-(acetyl-CoA carboxylase) ligase